MTTSSDSPPPTSASDRRTFLLRASAGVLVPAAAFFGWKQFGQQPGDASSSAPELPRYANQIGTAFTTAAGDEQPGLVLKLIQAAPAKLPKREIPGTLSLLFEAPAGQTITSRIHTLTHPTLGRVELFISPVGPGATRGEAIINTQGKPARA